MQEQEWDRQRALAVEQFEREAALQQAALAGPEERTWQEEDAGLPVHFFELMPNTKVNRAIYSDGFRSGCDAVLLALGLGGEDSEEQLSVYGSCYECDMVVLVSDKDTDAPVPRCKCNA